MYACNAEFKQAKGLQVGCPRSLVGQGGCGVYSHIIGMLSVYAIPVDLIIVVTSWRRERKQKGSQSIRLLWKIVGKEMDVLPRQGCSTSCAPSRSLPSSNPLKSNSIPQESPPQNISINLKTHNILPLLQVTNHILKLMPLSTNSPRPIHRCISTNITRT
jgi:hypothetical protein